MAFCSNCDATTIDGSAFCGACGTPVDAADVLPVEPPVAPRVDELWRSSLSIDGVPLPVAVKVINEANNEHLDDWSRRWQQQAEILRTLGHPGLAGCRTKPASEERSCGVAWQ